MYLDQFAIILSNCHWPRRETPYFFCLKWAKHCFYFYFFKFLAVLGLRCSMWPLCCMQASHCRALGSVIAVSGLSFPESYGILVFQPGLNPSPLQREILNHWIIEKFQHIIDQRDINLFNCLVPESCLTLWTTVDCSLPGSVHGIFQTRILGVGCHFLLQGIFPTQRSNLCLLHWQAGSLPLSHLGSPNICYPNIIDQRC